MVIILEKLFVVQLQMCDNHFQNQFRKFYQQLKAVDKVTGIKNVYQIVKNLYKLEIEKSKIALRVSNDTVTIGSFLRNEFYISQI